MSCDLLSRFVIVAFTSVASIALTSAQVVTGDLLTGQTYSYLTGSITNAGSNPTYSIYLKNNFLPYLAINSVFASQLA